MDKPFRPCYEPQYVTSTLAFHNEIKASSAQPQLAASKNPKDALGMNPPTVLEFMAVTTRVRIGTEPPLSRAEMCRFQTVYAAGFAAPQEQHALISRLVQIGFSESVIFGTAD